MVGRGLQSFAYAGIAILLGGASALIAAQAEKAQLHFLRLASA